MDTIVPRHDDGMAWSGLAGLGGVWLGLARSGSVRQGMVKQETAGVVATCSRVRTERIME
jgi:hypothetical protein